MPRYIDAEKIEFDLTGLIYIAPTDIRKIGAYFIRQLRDMPTEDVRPNIKGKWIFHGTAWKNEYRECSVCKCYFKADMPRNSFCPNCGADMRQIGGDTDES